MKFLADHNINDQIVTGLVRKRPGFDIVRAREVGLAEAPDPELLQWAAENSRVVVTYDKATMPDFAGERLRAGKAMPGLVVVLSRASVAQVIEDLLLADGAGTPEDWAGHIRYFPL